LLKLAVGKDSTSNWLSENVTDFCAELFDLTDFLADYTD